MWLLRRLKSQGATNAQLIDTLEKQLLPVLCLGASAWYCLLTQAEKTNIDRVGKVGMKIIFGEQYSVFENFIQLTDISRPTDTLAKMTKQLAAKIADHEKFSKWFQPLTTQTCTRSKKTRYIPIHTRTERFDKSPIPYLTKILNQN